MQMSYIFLQEDTALVNCSFGLNMHIEMISTTITRLSEQPPDLQRWGGGAGEQTNQKRATKTAERHRTTRKTNTNQSATNSS